MIQAAAGTYGVIVWRGDRHALPAPNHVLVGFDEWIEFLNAVKRGEFDRIHERREDTTDHE